MIGVLFLLCAVNLSVSKNFNVRCNNDTERRGMSFTPVGGEFLGRYTVELCTEVNPNYTEWETRIYYYPNTTVCPPTINLMMQNKMRMHSRNVEYTKFDSNCTNVCLTKEFDLIFSSCYTVETKFLIGEKGPRFTMYNFNVTSLFDIDTIRANKPTVQSVNHEDKLTIIWHPGVPPTDYKVDMCDAENSSGGGELQCTEVSCSEPDWRTVRCAVSPPPPRCVHFALTHHAPWKSGPFHPQELAPYPYCPKVGAGGKPSLSGNNWTVMSWAVGVGCAAVVAVLAHQVWRSRRAQHFKKIVRKTWLILANNNDTRTDALADQIESIKTSRNILLVYARENVAGQRVVDALKTILEHYIDGQVLDIHSALVCRLSAAAPAEWVRGVAARRDVTILLLQTPALHLMYTHTHTHGTPLTVGSALFPTRVSRRAPSFGDSLVQLVLRLLTATDLHHAYHRLYVATLSEVCVETAGHVVPYRRHLLPRDVGLLVADLRARTPPAPRAHPAHPAHTAHTTGEEALITNIKQETILAPSLYGEDGLITAHREFVDMVKDNPSYLMDDLILNDEDTS